ncbi:ATP-binding protein [Pantoea sp. 18069]|uniref:ATP-binding protein n=1 Tax=Pantoea sp. 18069 TaxID=2681415 RepID=UPI00135A884E|nr:ATP-binding protein [Pantoea sp. 18069]
MKNPVSLRCDLHGTVQELPAFFERLEAWADASGVPPGPAARLGLMLDEWLTNVAMHAYGSQGGPVSVQVDFLPPEILQCVVRDRGPAFDPTGIEEPDVGVCLDDREIGGLGIHFVRRLAHHFSYRRDGDCNEVTLGPSLLSNSNR